MDKKRWLLSCLWVCLLGIPGVEAKKTTTGARHNLFLYAPSLQFEESLSFDYNKATLRPESFPVLEKLAETLVKDPSLYFRVEGHTDHRDPYRSLDITKARTKAIVQFLVEKGGVSKERLYAKSYGDECPIASNKTEEGKSKNRRFEVVLVKDEASLDGPCRASAP